MKSRVTVDCSLLPVVVQTITGVPSLEELDASLRVFDDLLRRRVRYVLVLDVAQMGMIPSALRQRAARWLIENAIDVVQCCLGVYCVATNPIARAALTAMEWLDPRGAKYVVLETLDEAVRCARVQVASAGLSPAEA